MKRQIAIESVCFLLILLFVYAGFNKLTDYEKFVIQLGQSPLLIGLGPYVAPVVIIVELVISLILAFPLTRLLGFYASFTLMVMFTTYIIVILNFSDHIPCSCGGVLERFGWGEHLVFNIVFVALTASAAILEASNKASSVQSDRT